MVVLLPAILLVCGAARAQTDPWQQLDAGLFLAELDAPQKSEFGDSKITIVRIDPARYVFKLLSASEHDREVLTAREWCRRHTLIAAVNAGMYQKDGITAVGYMKNFHHVNNPRLNKNNSILAFNAVDSSVPEVQLIDRECQDFSSFKAKYRSFVQGIRMISCDRRNVWSPQPDKWSIVAVGMDKSGQVLFIHSRSPYTVHDFIEMLLALPISIHNAMYLEGGPQASLYLSLGKTEVEKYGMLESALNDNSVLQVVFPIPNVIGVAPKQRDYDSVLHR
jgi:hypothetical protein